MPAEEFEEGFVGDGRKKHLTVVTSDGRRHEHGEVYLKHSVDAFVVSPDFEFPDDDSHRYAKADLLRAEIKQHHSACFVTTAAAGEGPTLDALRGFRDGAMTPTATGRALVAVYERVSPPIATTIAEHPDSRTARTVQWLVERCATLARRREAQSGLARRALSVLLTLLYVVGVALALAGHLLIRVRERVE
ncbi:CFI-box-CTERM domain-containing protein [Halomarina litorea]|uniref:CFI-box-CTERM domain-containing protein n=1 Tax=Halomarina litorea TaxID=2961595 RepID=UPI0020C283E0|nr:CFI-box-CTERM domain-containing protein [Halomarina sp. BCD28]